MRCLFLGLSVLCVGSLKAESYASPRYTLSLPEDLEYLPPQMTRPSSEGVEIVFVGTVYETSIGLSDLLYTTTRFQIKEGGKSEVNVIGGPMGVKLGARNGDSKVVYKGENSLIFLEKEDGYKKEFTHVLYFLSGSMGELVATWGNEYTKSFVRIEKKGKGV